MYNEGHQRELTVIWDSSASVYRIATEQERADPEAVILSAPKWGSYLNKNADNKDNPSCLIDLKTLKHATNSQLPDYFNYTVSVQQDSTDHTEIETQNQAHEGTKPGTAEEAVSYTHLTLPTKA